MEGSERRPAPHELPESELEPPRARRGRWLLGVLVAAGLLVVVVHELFLAVYVVQGVSMRPTLEQDQRVVVLKRGYDVARGDLLVFRNPLAPDQVMIKRVIALPGETVECRDGYVYVGGIRMGQPWAKPGTQFGNRAREAVPEDAYYLVGDNRAESLDSRRLGAIPQRLVIGKVLPW